MPDWQDDPSSKSQDLPMYYSFNLGNIHFISISTEYYYFLNYGGMQIARQYNWLVQDLEKAVQRRQEQPWIVIYGHRPMYCSDDDHDDCTFHSSRTRAGLPLLHLWGLEELLQNYSVDLVLWAHEHDFERFWPVYNFQIKNGSLNEPYTNPKAPVHIITGSAGCQEKHDPWLPKPDITALRSTGYTGVIAHNATHLELEHVSEDHMIIFESRRLQVTISEQIHGIHTISSVFFS